VLDWCKEMLGFPASGSGLLVSGGSVANMVALGVARNSRAGVDVRKHGVRAAPPLTVYGSEELHSSVQKSVELLGLGSESLRLVPANDQFEIDVTALERMIAADREAGARPLAVVGGAGTVKTGAIDDLSRLADLCARENIWFHVDGAFGAVAALVPEFRTRLAGMERADSIAFDLHKWMYVPFEAGCVLVREAETHRHAFSVHPDYLARAERGLAAGAFWPEEYGMQLSRGFRALKVWLSFKEHGLDRYARLIAQNVAQARYLASLVERTPELELVAPVPLNIVCFRWVGDRSRDDAALDALNAELLMRIQERSIAAPSNATVRGRYALRVANTNHRTRREDMDLLVREVCRIGAELS
jgi:glutamate/tyrosine decarboxylase-like PLP-dependent enzyme